MTTPGEGRPADNFLDTVVGPQPEEPQLPEVDPATVEHWERIVHAARNIGRSLATRLVQQNDRADFVPVNGTDEEPREMRLPKAYPDTVIVDVHPKAGGKAATLGRFLTATESVTEQPKRIGWTISRREYTLEVPQKERDILDDDQAPAQLPVRTESVVLTDAGQLVVLRGKDTGPENPKVGLTKVARVKGEIPGDYLKTHGFSGMELKDAVDPERIKTGDQQFMSEGTTPEAVEAGLRELYTKHQLDRVARNSQA